MSKAAHEDLVMEEVRMMNQGSLNPPRDDLFWQLADSNLIDPEQSHKKVIVYMETVIVHMEKRMQMIGWLWPLNPRRDDLFWQIAHSNLINLEQSHKKKKKKKKKEYNYFFANMPLPHRMSPSEPKFRQYYSTPIYMIVFDEFVFNTPLTMDEHLEEKQLRKNRNECK